MFADELKHYLDAGYPLLWVPSHEEQRVEAEMRRLAEGMKRQYWRWSATEGWISGTRDTKGVPAKSPEAALFALADGSLPREEALFALRDFHPYLRSHEVVRRIRDILPRLKATGRSVVVVSPRLEIPLELATDITVLPFSLPTREELGRVLEGVAAADGAPTHAKDTMLDREALCEAALGLTAHEAENAYALAMAKHGDFSAEAALRTVQSEKAGAIRKSEVLQVYEPEVDLAAVGGLDALKAWLMRRGRAFSDEARMSYARIDDLLAHQRKVKGEGS